VGVIIYSVDDPMLPTYAFHFAFDPAESPAATFRRQIAHTTAGNWVQIRGGYRAVLCGAQVGNDAQQNAESAALLQAAVNAVRNEVRVTITGYVAGTGVAVDRAGTIYWPYGPGTPVNAPGY
jgi:hypothetical protein